MQRDGHGFPLLFQKFNQLETDLNIIIKNIPFVSTSNWLTMGFERESQFKASNDGLIWRSRSYKSRW
jgi:hypothetical protein